MRKKKQSPKLKKKLEIVFQMTEQFHKVLALPGLKTERKPLLSVLVGFPLLT